MNRVYRVSLEVDLSAIEKVDNDPLGGSVIFHFEVEGGNASEALFNAWNRFSEDSDIVAVVPVREG